MEAPISPLRAAALDVINRYWAFAGKPLDDDLAVKVLIDRCVEELRERLEFANNDMNYRDVREEVASFSRPQELRVLPQEFRAEAQPMDIASKRQDRRYLLRR